MKTKLLILSLSFLLISCGGPPSEDSKTTIMDVVKYLEEVRFVGPKNISTLSSDDEDWGNDENWVLEEGGCGKFEKFQPKIASMVGAIEGGKIYMENFMCDVEVYKYSDESAAILNTKSGLLENSDCFAKGYFVLCTIPQKIMNDF